MLAEPVGAPPTTLSYLEENSFSGSHSSEEASGAGKLKECGTATFLRGGLWVVCVLWV